MADPYANPLTLDLAAQQQQIARRQALAQMLMEKGMTPDQGQMVSGHYVAPNFLQALARLVNTGVGVGMQNQNDQASLDLGRQGAQRMDQAFTGMAPPGTFNDQPMNVPNYERPQNNSLAGRIVSAMTPNSPFPSPQSAPQAPQNAPQASQPTMDPGAAMSTGVLAPGNMPQNAQPQQSNDPRQTAIWQAARKANLTGNTELANKLVDQAMHWNDRTDMEKQNAYIAANPNDPAVILEMQKRYKEAHAPVRVGEWGYWSPDKGLVMIPRIGELGGLVEDKNSPTGYTTVEQPGQAEILAKQADIKQRSEAQYSPQVAYTDKDGPLYPGGPWVSKGTQYYINRLEATGNVPRPGPATIPAPAAIPSGPAGVGAPAQPATGAPAGAPVRTPLPPVPVYPGQGAPVQGQSTPPVPQNVPSGVPVGAPPAGVPVNPSIAVAPGAPIGATRGGAVDQGVPPGPYNKIPGPASAPPVSAPRILAGPPVDSVRGREQMGEAMRKDNDTLTKLTEQNSTVNSQLQTIKQLAARAAIGPASDKIQYLNGLLAFAGISDKAADANTANALLEKNANQIVARLSSSGALGTDSARTLLQAAYPNSHMSEKAIGEAVDNLAATNNMLSAKQQLLQPHALSNNPDSYRKVESQFNANADPRIWQLQGMDSKSQQEYVSKLNPNDAKQLLNKMRNLKKMGVF